MDARGVVDAGTRNELSRVTWYMEEIGVEGAARIELGDTEDDALGVNCAETVVRRVKVVVMRVVDRIVRCTVYKSEDIEVETHVVHRIQLEQSDKGYFLT